MCYCLRRHKTFIGFPMSILVALKILYTYTRNFAHYWSALWTYWRKISEVAVFCGLLRILYLLLHGLVATLKIRLLWHLTDHCCLKRGKQFLIIWHSRVNKWDLISSMEEGYHAVRWAACVCLTTTCRHDTCVTCIRTCQRTLVSLTDTPPK